MEIKTCCFIGHRKIEINKELEKNICNYIENLILNENVKVFLLGSRSEFNSLCHSIVYKLKSKYKDIKLVAYDCKSETSILQSEKEEWERIFSKNEKLPISLLCVDEKFDYRMKYISTKASYIERNQAMIDNSDYCLFFYNKNYLPPKRKQSKNSINSYQPNSGTAIAYKYATQKNKIVFNFFK